MDPVIISALITAGSSALWFVIGLIKKDSVLLSIRFKTNKEVLHEQLTYLYEPLIKVLDRSTETNQELIITATEIIDHHYYLIPNDLYSEFKILSSGCTLSNKQFAHFSAFIQSNYNWVKKTLGYPFDEALIDKKFLPQYQKHQSTKDIFKSAFGAVTGISAYMFPVFLWFITLNPESNFESFPKWMIVWEIASGFCFFAWGIIIIHKIWQSISDRKYNRVNDNKK